MTSPFAVHVTLVRRMRFGPAALSSVVATITCGVVLLALPAVRGDDPGEHAVEVVVQEVAGAIHLAREIDRLIQEGTADYASQATPLVDDAGFLRRVYLDLVGTIPSVEEAREFLNDVSSDKREELVERLLHDQRHDRHLQRWLDNWLMQRRPQTSVPIDQWQAFLLEGCRDHKPFHTLIEEILSCDGSNPEQRGPAHFYLGRNGDKDTLTRDISGLLLGANLECAQCHDHPHVGDYLQRHYHSLAAYLVRSTIVTDAEGVVSFAEQAAGESVYEDVLLVRAQASPGPQTARPSVFDAPSVEEPTFAEGEEYEVAPAEGVRPVPKFSRRAFLASAVVNDPRFARNTANRVWAMLLGRGLVEPLDMLSEENPASHPELLDLLTRELVDADYDLRHIIRGIVLSETYQRSSRLLQTPEEERFPYPSTFAQASLRALTPAQFAHAVLEATGETGIQRRAQGEHLSEATLHQALVGYENTFRGLLAAPAGQVEDRFETLVSQTLWFSNEATLHNLIAPHGGNLAERLLAYSPDDPIPLIEELFLATLTRLPTAEEYELMTEFLSSATSDHRARLVQDAIWALVMSSEMRFNH